MAENSGIEWTHHTFNPWIGCTKVSPACDFCYAEAWDNRFAAKQGSHWGPHADRRRTKTFGNPVKWNKALEGTGHRERVFCASLADIFDNHKSIQQEWRDDVWKLIRETPNLDWLLLTKRPQNIRKYLPDDWGNGYQNVWIGTTVENQKTAEQRIPHLISVPAKIRFLSCEPLIDEVRLTSINAEGNGLGLCTINPLTGEHHDMFRPCPPVNVLHWVITGGESGPNFRPANPDWFRSLRDQCNAAGVPFLFKQWEGKNQKEIKALGRELDGVVHDGYPTPPEGEE